jgi:5-formyltetrahydrofolate cyclo-ligase
MASAESGILADQKRSLRQTIGGARSRLGADQRAEAASAAAARMTALPELRAAAARGACIAGFVATRTEIDPAAILHHARQAGADIAYPRVAGTDTDAVGRLRFHRAATTDLHPGRFGILEPDAACPEVQPEDVAVMIVPGLAFDRAGNRLGYGGGYFDEVLNRSGVQRPRFVVGLGYDFQVVDSCPVDERDARVDCVVTDTRVIRCVPGATEVG